MTAAVARIRRDDGLQERDEERLLKDAETDPRNRNSELLWYMAPFKGHRPLLATEEVLRLFHEYRCGRTEADRLAARDALVYGNMKLVLKIGLSRQGRGLALLDLCQEGVFGLIRAIELFEPERGYRFSTYAVQWIRQAMSRAIADMDERKPFRIPVHLHDRMNLVKVTVFELLHELGRQPHPFEIFQAIRAKNTQIAQKTTLRQVVRCQSLINAGYVPLDAEISRDEQTTTVGDLFADTQRINTETVLEATHLLRKYRAAKNRIERTLTELDDPRRAMILRWRFGIGDFERMTLEQVAERYDLSRQRIRQLEVDALAQLQEKLHLTGVQIFEILDVTDELERIVASV